MSCFGPRWEPVEIQAVFFCPLSNIVQNCANIVIRLVFLGHVLTYPYTPLLVPTRKSNHYTRLQGPPRFKYLWRQGGDMREVRRVLSVLIWVRRRLFRSSTGGDAGDRETILVKRLI